MEQSQLKPENQKDPNTYKAENLANIIENLNIPECQL